MFLLCLSLAINLEWLVLTVKDIIIEIDKILGECPVGASCEDTSLPSNCRQFAFWLLKTFKYVNGNVYNYTRVK